MSTRNASPHLLFAFFCLIAVLILVPRFDSLSAQDVTPTETATLTATATETPTLVPTDPETAITTLTATETATETPTETAAASETAKPTAEIVEMSSPTVTLVETPTATTTSEIATLSPSFTPMTTNLATIFPDSNDTVTVEPEIVGVPVVKTDNFDTKNSAVWSENIDEVVDFINGDSGLHFAAEDVQPLALNNGNIGDVIAQTQILVNSGTAKFAVRHSEAGEYRVQLTADGQLSLYKGNALQSTVTVTTGVWHQIQLAAVGGLLTVSVDGTQVISLNDPSPLPSGMIYFSSDLASINDFWIDDFSMSGIQEAAPLLYPVSETALTLRNEFVSVMDVGGPNKIAFTSGRNGNSDIFVMESNGSNQVPVIVNPAIDGEAEWSPDGTRIAFSSSRSGNQEIYVANANGSNLIQLTVASTTSDVSPTWASNGYEIAFTKNTGLCTVNVNFGNSSVFCFPASPTGSAYTPAWRPNTPTIYYSDANNGISAFTSAGTWVGQLIANGGSPSFSPDGNRLAYQGISPAGLFVYNFSTQNTQQITNNALQDHNPSWSGDGNQLVFDSTRFGVSEVYKVSSSGTPLTGWTNLSNNPGTDFNPDWSPGAGGATSTPTATRTPTPTPTFTPSPTPFTDLNFNDGGQQALYQAVMFWAVFMENIADTNDSGSPADSDLPSLYNLPFRYTDFLFSSPFCSPGSRPPSDNAQEPIVLGDPINNPTSKWVYIKHCNKDHRYMFARSMLNGFLNYERRDLEIWGYAADYSVLTNTVNTIWTISPCQSNDYGATYQIAFESGLQIPWLNAYLLCVAQNSAVDRTGSDGVLARSIKRAFDLTILPQVRSAVTDFHNLGITDHSNGAYTNLDMSFNGGDTVLSCVGGCYPNLNSTIKYVYLVSQADGNFSYAKTISNITPQDIRTAYDLFIQQAQTYNPNYSSILQPVLRYDLYPNGSVKGLIWSSRVYQRSAEMGHYPR